MFEKLIDVLLALVAELKRYNDGRGADAPAQPSTPAPKDKPAAKKTAPAAPPAEKLPTFDEVQAQAVTFMAEHPRKREALLEVLTAAGVQPVDVGGKPVVKISSAKDNPAMLSAIAKGLTAALEAEAV